jgi:hypothetical protein
MGEAGQSLWRCLGVDRLQLPYILPTKGRNGSRKLVTPAMAAGLTDYVWAMDELLSFRVPPKRLCMTLVPVIRDTTSIPLV